MSVSFHFVDLADRYAVDSCLLGRSFSFNYACATITVTLPSVIRKNGFLELGIPGLMDNYGVDAGDWGKINSYWHIDKPEPVDAWISTALVKCSEKDQHKKVSIQIPEMAKKVVYALQILNPDAIRIPNDEVPNVICDVKTSVEIKEDGKPQAMLKIASVFDDRKGRLSFGEIKTAIQNADKVISAPYEMLGNAQMNISRHDWRAAVLNCATAIEVMIKKKIMAYFDESSVPLELQEHVLKQADGLPKLKDLCKSLSISLTGLPNVQDEIMKIRHRVIHSGYVPTPEEANKAYESARLALESQNAPVFE